MKPKIALALIVKGSDEEAEMLYKSLTSFQIEHGFDQIDGLFVTITQPNERVEEVAKNFGATTSHFEWCNDYAKARNFNFSQVPPDFTHILWFDADDGIRGVGELKRIVEEHPEVDAFSMYYYYSFDDYKNPVVVHQKTQIVKNDGCVEWAGRVHEDFKENRQLNRFFIKGMERIHLSEPKRFESAKKRNYDIALEQVKDSPDDPRSYWNLGNAQFSLEQFSEAIASFDKFLETSLSDDEKYIVRLRRAECFYKMGKRTEALDECKYAIGLKINYPDAYILSGHLFYSQKQYFKAAEHFYAGLLKGANPPYYQIVVYNPRDYDYVPMINLAKCYMELARPDLALPMIEGCLKIYPNNEDLKKTAKDIKKESSKLKKVVKYIGEIQSLEGEQFESALQKIPVALRSHPAVCAVRNQKIIKKESSGKDLVFFCGVTSEIWTPETARKKGIGGSEEAIIWLSKLFSKFGYNVTVYNNCGHRWMDFDGVWWKPWWEWNPRDKQDITIIWRAPRFLEYDINSKRIFLDLHDTIQEGEFTPSRLAKVEKIFVKSKFHRSLYPSIPDEKFAIVPNGIDPVAFEFHPEDPSRIKRRKYMMVNTSSPDRSLNALLDCFAEIKKQIPEAECYWAYGWNVYDASNIDNIKAMEWKTSMVEKMKSIEGFYDLGRISHGDIAKLYQQANVFAYPTEFAEIDCISMTKAMAAGAIPITSDFSAIREKRDPMVRFIHSQKTKDNWNSAYQIDFSMQDESMKRYWIDSVIDCINNSPSEEERLSMRSWAVENFNWNHIAHLWLKEF